MTVRIVASRHTAFYSPLLATMAGGFLEQQGLGFTYRTLAPGETAAGVIRDGQADVVQSAPSTKWARMDRGETGFPLNFALINRRDGFFLVGHGPARPAFEWKQLEGATLLADHGSQPLTMLRYAAKHNGADWQRINVVDAGSAEKMTAAFRAGEGDFLHVQAPAPQILEEEGAGCTAVSVGASMPANAFSSLCAAREFFSTPMFPAFVEAFGKGKRWVQQTAAEEIAAKLGPHFTDVSLTALTAAIAGYQEIGAWAGGPEIPRDLYEQSLNVFETTGRISKRHPYDECCVDCG